MADFIAQFGGIGLAFLGAALAVGRCCVGSARGTGMVGEAATGVLSETPEHFSKCLILAGDLVCLVESPEFNKRNLQTVMKILCRKSGFRVKYQIKICLRHGLIFLIVLASGDFMDGLNSCAVQKIIQLTLIDQRREKSKQVHHISFFLLWLQKGI